MPIITVAMYSGRSQRDKDRLTEAIPEDVVNMLKVDKKKKDISISLKNRTQFYYLN
jgi:4-oxalocrotonate tautomerase